MAKIKYNAPLEHIHGKITKDFQCRVLNGQDIIQGNPDRSRHINTPDEASNKQHMAAASRRASELKRQNAPEYVAAMMEYDERLAAGETLTTRWNYWVSCVRKIGGSARPPRESTESRT